MTAATDRAPAEKAAADRAASESATAETAPAHAKETDAKPSKLEQLREKYAWLDHLVRAGARFTDHHGSHYGAAITYFSLRRSRSCRRNVP